MKRYSSLKTNGVRFIFTVEEDPPGMLHIYARHRKTKEDAVFVYFNGDSVYLNERKCWQTSLGKETLWWFWLDESAKVVMVISCFEEYAW